MKRKELYDYIKKNRLQDQFVIFYNKNYTNCKNAILEKEVKYHQEVHDLFKTTIDAYKRGENVEVTKERYDEFAKEVEKIFKK